MSISSLQIALTGLRAAQAGTEVSSHNIANAGTEGFSRQRVEQTSGLSRRTNEGFFGTGTKIVDVTRSRDQLLDDRVRSTTGRAAAADIRHTTLLRAEDAFGEPDGGITASLGRLWGGFSDLATRPGDLPTRQNMIGYLDDLASRVNATRSELEMLEGDAQVRLVAEVSNANDLIDRIAELNRRAVGAAGLPADLADERDRAADTLAESLGAKVTVLPNGLMRVAIGGAAIVDGEVPLHLTTDPLSPGTVTHPTGPVTLGGVAGGLQTSLLADLPMVRGELDSFVTTLITELNTTHAAGFKPDGTAGGPLLADVAGRIQVTVTNPADLAVADAVGGGQNGRWAQQLADLKFTIDPAARNMVSAVAAETANVGRTADTEAGLAVTAAEARLSVMGVNMDEEMVNLTTYARAYAGAARIVTTVEEMFDALLRM